MSKEMTTMAVRRGGYLVGLAELVGLQNPAETWSRKWNLMLTRQGHTDTRTHARAREHTHTHTQ